jgi:hypothetical protein
MLAPKDLELNLKTLLQVNQHLFMLPHDIKNIGDVHVAAPPHSGSVARKP